MGREIRRVPADWEHPKRSVLDYRTGQMVDQFQPLFDRTHDEVAREWLDNAIAWDKGDDPHKATHPFYWQWADNPPDPKYYRPKWTSEPAHYQVYETVSEGTPVTPHFATKEELIDYLVEWGDSWWECDPRYKKKDGWSRKNAMDFVEREWAPSGLIVNGVWHSPKDGMPI